MPFDVYLKKDIGNQISFIIGNSVKKFSVSNIEISSGLLKKGSYQIPVEHILFIEEV